MENVLLKEVFIPELDIKTGTIFDQRFKILKPIDNKRVFLACDLKLASKLYAIKIAPKESIYSSKFNLRREYIIHSIFDHSNISSVKEAFEDENYFGYLMEYAGGGDLYSLMSKGKVKTLFEAVDILKGILRGLAQIHSKNVIHADIKPENILISSALIPKITDFGVAHEFTYLPIKENEIKGTLKYLCPVYAKTGLMHTSIDVYAVGLIAFELITKEVPLFFSDPVKMFKARLSNKIPSLGNYIDSIKYSELIHAIDKSIDKDPSKRFQNAEEFLNAIPERLLNDMVLSSKYSKSIINIDSKHGKKKSTTTFNERSKTKYSIEFA